jgi:predicted nucleic acid-binding protein
MRRAFADSLYWIALSHPGDQWHAAAMKASRALPRVEIVTTHEMLSEFLTAFRHTARLRTIAARRRFREIASLDDHFFQLPAEIRVKRRHQGDLELVPCLIAIIAFTRTFGLSWLPRACRPASRS